MAPSRVAVSTYDFKAKEVPALQIPGAILTFTTQKGYCLLQPGIDRQVVSSAKVEATAVPSFAQPPAEIAEGLLGPEGSAEVVDFGQATGVSLQAVHGTVTGIMESLMQLTANTTYACDTVSSPLIHSSDIPGDEPPELTMGDCDKWATEFAKSRFMCIFNLGGRGTLELEPFIHKDCAAIEVTMEPGSLLVLRTDAVSHSFTSPKKSFLLTCFLTKERLDTELCDPLEDGGIPAAKHLRLWMSEQLRAAKSESFQSAEPVVGLLQPDFPSEWRALMNRQYHKPNSVAIRSFACKHPGSWDPAEYAHCLITGCDLVEQIPFHRFDWTKSYTEDPEPGSGGYIITKHGAYIEGMSLFDPKMFQISLTEAKFMDPCQRVVLETGYEALVNANFTKKELVKNYIGCYVGTSTSEVQLAEQQNDDQLSSGLGGTSAANSITANRTSFVLGIQGPNVAIDCAAASGLVGTFQAVDTLRFQSERFSPCHHAIVSNVCLALSRIPLMIQSAAGFLSQDGRCFSFDATANGYCKGEGCASMCVGQWATQADGEWVLNKARPTLGLVSSVACQHAGRLASLTAASGPEERQIISYMIEQALITPLDMDAFEPHGQGALMHDAVEVASLRTIFRDNEEVGGAVCASSVKSQSSFMMESCGLAQLMKVVYMQGYGASFQGIHVNQVNPFAVMETGDLGGIHLLTEAVRLPARASYVGTFGRGFGGTMGAVTTWGTPEPEDEEGTIAQSRGPRHLVEPLAFWPAGGGEVSELNLPESSYDIVGSWSGYEDSAHMEEEDEEGVYGYTVTLGESGEESFYIRLDDDPERVLYPAISYNGAPAVGPRRWVREVWTLGGEADWIVPPPEQAAIADGASSPGTGAGKKYRVRLRISGTYQSVDWVPTV